MKNLLIALLLAAPARAGLYYDLRQQASSATLKMGGNISLGATTTGAQSINLDGVAGVISGAIDGNINSVVNVQSYATGGSGTQGSPWTGWDTAITWTAQTHYFFQKGWFSYTTCPNWEKQGIFIEGANRQGTVLNYKGSGNAVCFDGGTGGTPAANYGMTLEHLRIFGSAAAVTTNGVYIQNSHHVTIKDVSVNNIGGACFFSHFSINGLLESFYCDVNEGLGNPDITPSTGVYMGAILNGFNQPTNSWKIDGAVITGVTGAGIDLDYAGSIELISGDSESNGTCLLISGSSSANNIHNLYSNCSEKVGGTNDSFFGGTYGGVMELAGATFNRFYGGQYQGIVVDSTGTDNVFVGVSYGLNGSGTFVDNGVNTKTVNTFAFGVSSATYRDSTIGAGLTVTGGNFKVATSTFSITGGQVAIGGAAAANAALTVIGKTNGNGPTFSMIPNGGDIGMAAGSSIFRDGVTSYAHGTYEQSRLGGEGWYASGNYVFDVSTSVVVISSLTVQGAGGLGVTYGITAATGTFTGVVTAPTFSGALSVIRSSASITGSITATSGYVCFSTLTWTSRGNWTTVEMITDVSNTNLSAGNVFNILLDGALVNIAGAGNDFVYLQETVANDDIMVHGAYDLITSAGLHHVCLTAVVSAGTGNYGINATRTFKLTEY